jgi:hypothetical protein
VVYDFFVLSGEADYFGGFFGWELDDAGSGGSSWKRGGRRGTARERAEDDGVETVVEEDFGDGVILAVVEVGAAGGVKDEELGPLGELVWIQLNEI